MALQRRLDGNQQVVRQDTQKDMRFHPVLEVMRIIRCRFIFSGKNDVPTPDFRHRISPTVNLDPDRLSFTGCFQILKCRLPECDGKTPATFEAWYQGLLWEMQGERTDPRRNRINPRVIKRKMSKWKKKRPEHRHRPP